MSNTFHVLTFNSPLKTSYAAACYSVATGSKLSSYGYPSQLSSVESLTIKGKTYLEIVIRHVRSNRWEIRRHACFCVFLSVFLCCCCSRIAKWVNDVTPKTAVTIFAGFRGCCSSKGGGLISWFTSGWHNFHLFL